MTPYSAAPLKMSRVLIAIDGKVIVTVAWSVPSNGGTQADELHLQRFRTGAEGQQARN